MADRRISASRLIPAADLARARFPGVTLPGVYGEFLGDVAPDAQILVYGGPGSGKSTLALGLAAEWTRRVGPTVYVAAEEGAGKTLAERARRLGATPAGLAVAVYDPQVGLAGVLADVKRSGASAVFLDSQTWVDPDSRAFAAFAQALKEAGVMLVTIAHETKAGKYRGNADVGHRVDTVVKVENGVAQTTKNRFATLAEVKVPFTAARANPAPGCACQQCTSCGGTVRSNPPHSGRCAYAKGSECECRCGGRLHGSTITRVKGAAKTTRTQTRQGRAVMASLTKSGKKKVRAGAGAKARPATAKRTVKPAPRRTPAAPKLAPKPPNARRKRAATAPAKRAAARKPSGTAGQGVAAQLAAIQKQISSL